jgi:hypothetical protein
MFQNTKAAMVAAFKYFVIPMVPEPVRNPIKHLDKR